MTEPALASQPRPRSPAQVEASRRNGARSRGPVTPDGKRRSSANARKHGLAALHYLVLDDEDPRELEGLTARLLAELWPEDELEARLVRRLAVAFWKGERAERMEVALLDGAPRAWSRRPAAAPGRRPSRRRPSTCAGSTPSAATRRRRGGRSAAA